MKPEQIIIERTEDDKWRAFVDEDRDACGIGKNPFEALEELGLLIKFTE